MIKINIFLNGERKADSKDRENIKFGGRKQHSRAECT